MNAAPQAIRLDVPGNRLHVDWQDGHRSVYDLFIVVSHPRLTDVADY